MAMGAMAAMNEESWYARAIMCLGVTPHVRQASSMTATMWGEEMAGASALMSASAMRTSRCAAMASTSGGRLA